MEIAYVTGDATRPQGTGPRIIVHICNDIGGWGSGFVLALSRRWAAPERAYRDWYQGKTDIPFELGRIQLVEVEDSLWVANLIGQRNVHAVGGVPPVRYSAIRQGLGAVAGEARKLGATVHMPRIGCGLAGGDWGDG